MSGFFPKAVPRARHKIPVETGHHLHVSEYGCKEGFPLVYLHGGPGGGIPQDAPRIFDPELFRVVLFDQRGCGLSTCEDRLRDNTLAHLLADIETVRVTLEIDTWAVMGSSFGSLLAALYAARHARRVEWAVLHGVFLGSRAEISWLYEEGGASRFYPEQWKEFSAAVLGQREEWSGTSETHSQNEWPIPLLREYHVALTQPGVPRRQPLVSFEDTVPAKALWAAQALTRWEDDMETLAPCPADHDTGELLAGAQIAVHYFFNDCFLPRDGALTELRSATASLAQVPCAILNGRHDVICPPHTAAALHSLWPGSELHIVEGGAHALFEKPLRSKAQSILAQYLFGSAADGTARSVHTLPGLRKRRRR